MSLAEPITYTYLEAVQGVLQGITQAAGYYTDLGLHVTLEPEQIPDDAEGLALVVLDGTTESSEPAIRSQRVRGRDATLSIVIKLPFGLHDAQRTLHRMLADVDRAMDFRAKAFPLRTVAPKFVSSEPATQRPDQQGSILWTGWVLRYRLSYIPDRNAPAPLPPSGASS